MASFKNRRKTIKRRKGRRNNKSKKYRNRKKSIKMGGKILGTGKDGCVIDSINYGNYTNDNGYVAKILNSVINYDLINRLKQIDPNEIRFVHYIMPDETFDMELLKQNEDYMTCKNNLSGNLNIIFMKKLNPINTRELNKQQYRYLRESFFVRYSNYAKILKQVTAKAVSSKLAVFFVLHTNYTKILHKLTTKAHS